MISQIRRLAWQTLVYGTGNVLTRFVTFLLLPLFTHVLTQEEYGIATLVYVFLGFMNIIYHYGLDAAFMRHVSELEDGQEKKKFFSTAVWLSLGTSGIFSLLIMTLGRVLSVTLLGDEGYERVFVLAAGILFLDTLSHVPFALLRMQEKAVIFTLVKLLNVVATLGLNIYFVGILSRGITGIFTSAFLASVITTLSVITATVVSFRFTFIPRQAKEFVKFGLPFVPAGLAAIAMEMIDRYILAYLKDTSAVGLYSAGYKLGILMLLLTTAFNYAWQPFFLKMGNTREARPVFARIFTYFVLVATFVLLTVTAFIHEIIHVRIFGYSIIGPAFYDAEPIVPLILCAYVFQGAYLNFLPGIYFEKRTYQIPLITGVGAVVNIVFNFLLIPVYGMMGAAVATLAGFSTMAVLTFFVSRRLFPVSYEWSKIFRIVICTALGLAVIFLFGQTIVAKLIGILVFVTGILVLKVLSPGVKKEIGQLF